MESESLSAGRKVIQHTASGLPSTPGVYRMIDAEGNVLYVGKAKHLKNRVTSYLSTEVLSRRLQVMIARTASMEIVTTRSEAEALLLEANLIKKLQPRFNILLRDDKSFPYILFSGDHEFACISKHRGAKTKKGKYYGPFVSAGAVNETITLLQKAFLLRSCTDSVFKNRTRPCMLYQIKRCSGPCAGRIDKQEYEALVAQAQGFLTGKSRQIQEELIAQMQQYSLQMQYEKAKVIRDRVRALTQVQQQGGLVSNVVGDADVIAMVRDGGDCCVQVFSYRGGRNYGNKAYFPLHTAESSDAEIVRNALAQFYQSQPVPPLILTSHLLEEAPLLEEAFRLHTDYKVEIIHPLRGEKSDLMKEAVRNAREALVRHRSLHVQQAELLDGIRELFGLEDTPRRIEVYDNSHISGTNAVGVMIVAGPDGFIKNEYRRFDIKDTRTMPGDDYAMMREVLTRRFKRMLDSGEEVKKPDLVLIDGGAGQLSAAAKVFEDLGISDICFAGIAKGPDRNAGREQFFIPGRDPFQMPLNDPLLHYLQRLRDEAHRFAIGTHRSKRSRSIQASELDEIPFIGPNRKKALLLHFGSVRSVAAAGVDDLLKVEGISRSTAQIIYDFFHGGTQ